MSTPLFWSLKLQYSLSDLRSKCYAYLFFATSEKVEHYINCYIHQCGPFSLLRYQSTKYFQSCYNNSSHWVVGFPDYLCI